jgi:toxin ParE1/3/4
VRSSRRSHKIGKKPPLQLTIQYHPDAVTEMAEAALFYEDRQTGLGERLLNAIEEALEVIKTHPTMWRADERGRRKYRVKRFPYLLIYKVTQQTIVILAIAHTSRKPGYWESRDQ